MSILFKHIWGTKLQEKIKMEQLEYFGIPSYIINIWKKNYSDTLLPVQEKAVRQFGLLQHGYSNNINIDEYRKISNPLLVVSPSSSGKTLVGEMAAIKEIITQKKVIFLVPLRVLAEEKYQHFQNLYQSAGLKVKVSSGDHRHHDRDIIGGDFHIAVIVYEKFYYLQLQYPGFLNNVSLVVADEIQLINDLQRGPRLENNLDCLRMRNPNIRIIALSAFSENTIHLAKYLGASVLFSSYRPLELRKGIVRNGIYQYIEHNTSITGKEVFFAKDDAFECNLASYLKATLSYLINNNESSLIFFSTKKEVRIWSRWLAEQFNLSPAKAAINELNTLEDSTSRDELISLLQNSIVYHCADLSRQERQLIEKAVRSCDIKIICATDTLSMGVNLPVNNVILTGQKIISKKNNELLLPNFQKRALTLSEVENMGGRAGRLKQQECFGRIIFLAPSLIELTAYQRLYFNSSNLLLPGYPLSKCHLYTLPAPVMQDKPFEGNAYQINEGYSDNSKTSCLALSALPAKQLSYSENFLYKVKPVKIEYDILTFILQRIAQKQNTLDGIYNFSKQDNERISNNFWHYWHYKFNKNITRKKMSEILRQLEDTKLVKNSSNIYYLTEMGALIVSRGICFQTYIHFRKWLENCCKNEISELEIIFLISTSVDGENSLIPSPVYKTTKFKKSAIGKWKKYLSMKILSLLFELGEDNKPIFQLYLNTESENKFGNGKKIDLKKYLSIKKTLLLFDWINGRELREIEEDYGVLSGAIQNIGEGFSWLSDTLAAIAAKIGWGEQRPVDLNRIKQLAKRLSFGVETDGLSLAGLEIPNLTRAYIKRLVQQGYNNKECLQELTEEQLNSLLPERITFQVKQHIQRDAGKHKNIFLMKDSNQLSNKIKNNSIKTANGKTAKSEEIIKPELIINMSRPDKILFFQEEIPVTRINFQLVLLLTKKQGQMISYDEIIDNLWPEDEDATYHRLWYHLGKLRSGMKLIIQHKKITDSPEKFIKEKILKVFPGRGVLFDENILVKIEK